MLGICWSGKRNKSKSKLYYDRQSVGQSVLVSGTHLEPATNFSFSLKFSVIGLLFCSAHSDERTGLKFTVATDPRQSSPAWVRVPRDSRPYFIVPFIETPNLKGQVPVFISPRNKVAQIWKSTCDNANRWSSTK
jgi:hypothetical protein